MKPTERFKRRYISFSLSLSGMPPAYPEAKEIVHVHFLSFFGESGISSLAFKLVKYDAQSGEGILRCERSRTDEAIFCMACLSEWKGAPARLEPKSTSGTIKRL
ncbi:MAG: Rpp14/Pop5 family protein [Candidatus Micrarchaeia archaeon]